MKINKEQILNAGLSAVIVVLVVLIVLIGASMIAERAKYMHTSLSRANASYELHILHAKEYRNLRDKVNIQQKIIQHLSKLMDITNDSYARQSQNNKEMRKIQESLSLIWDRGYCGE